MHVLENVEMCMCVYQGECKNVYVDVHFFFNFKCVPWGVIVNT